MEKSSENSHFICVFERKFHYRASALNLQAICRFKAIKQKMSILDCFKEKNMGVYNRGEV